MTNIDPSELATVTGGAAPFRNLVGGVLGVPSGLVGGLVSGTYKAVTEKNDWATFGRGFSTGYDNVGGFAENVGHAAVDLVSGGVSSVRDNWGK